MARLHGKILLLTLLFIVSALFLSKCASSSLALETKVNDPIMMNLLDVNADISQIEDGTGAVGEAAACPT